MSNSKLRLAITPEDKAWIESNYFSLLEEFGRQKYESLSIVEAPIAFFEFNPKLPLSQQLPKVRTKLCQRFDIDPKSVVIKPEALDLMNGQYYSSFFNTQNYREEFIIGWPEFDASELNFALSDMVMGFVYYSLYGTRRINYEQDHPELYLELASIFFGFGILKGNLAFEFKADNVGYSMQRNSPMQLELWAYALAMDVWLRKESDTDWAAFLNPDMYVLFQQCLDYLNETGDCQLGYHKAPIKGKNPDILSFLHPDTRKALKQINQDIQTGASTHDALIQRAELYAANHLYEAAFADYHQILSENPTDAFAISQKGLLFLDLGFVDEAHAHIQQALQTQPNHLGVQLDQANLLLRVGDIDGAEGHFLSILNQKPDSIQALLGRGLILEAKGELKAAKIDLDRVLKFDSRNAVAYYHRAAILIQEGMDDAALKDLDRAILYDPKLYNAYLLRGTYHRAKDQFDRAVADFETILHAIPGHEAALYELDIAQQRMHARESGELVQVFHSALMEELHMIQKSLKAAGINAKIDNPASMNFTAGTQNHGRVILVKEAHTEEAIGIIGRVLNNAEHEEMEKTIEAFSDFNEDELETWEEKNIEKEEGTNKTIRIGMLLIIIVFVISLIGVLFYFY